ncbi:DUF342 domain-containing protein [Acetobacterium tundrae]|uniref:DUF342 domain-containing protein n=1 Tax=Acetobacterium tundrae TaxID=132932 RepID=A0ABR6WL33_9FIRM|nr:FapA family protein [Acetobacterium tundrae]MBC3797074.1 DUF342 domain-containing protein [Acetobacterium tundrae]
MNEEKDLKEDHQSAIKVIVSEDQMVAFIKFSKQAEESPAFSKEQIIDHLKQNKVEFGINEVALTKLAHRPIYNIKIKVAEGKAVVDGKDGGVKYFIKKDSEYHPEYNEDEEQKIDYKNLNYFQMVAKNQILCEITKEKEGTDGINVYGEVISAKNGRGPAVPTGKNTELIEGDTKLIATCDGIVKFIGNTIHINEMLHISSNVDFSTGNISFSGDVTIDGDVCSGFSVKSGGNLIVKGVVEEAKIEVAGNVLISKGIYGGRSGQIKIGKDLRCNYIEKAHISVGGDITVDFIIDGQITCMGNIELAGSREIIIGGEIQLTGELTAKEIGNERELPTIIRILGENTVNMDVIENLNKKMAEKKLQMKATFEKKTQVKSLILDQERKDIRKNSQDDDALKQLTVIKKEIDKQINALQNNINEIKAEIEKEEKQGHIDYFGSVSVKRKLHRGVKICFGESIFQHELDNLEHCKIYWSDDQIINGML